MAITAPERALRGRIDAQSVKIDNDNGSEPQTTRGDSLSIPYNQGKIFPEK